MLGRETNEHVYSTVRTFFQIHPGRGAEITTRAFLLWSTKFMRTEKVLSSSFSETRDGRFCIACWCCCRYAARETQYNAAKRSRRVTASHCREETTSRERARKRRDRGVYSQRFEWMRMRECVCAVGIYTGATCTGLISVYPPRYRGVPASPLPLAFPVSPLSLSLSHSRLIAPARFIIYSANAALIWNIYSICRHTHTARGGGGTGLCVRFADDG